MVFDEQNEICAGFILEVNTSVVSYNKHGIYNIHKYSVIIIYSYIYK